MKCNRKRKRGKIKASKFHNLIFDTRFLCLFCWFGMTNFVMIMFEKKILFMIKQELCVRTLKGGIKVREKKLCEKWEKIKIKTNVQGTFMLKLNNKCLVDNVMLFMNGSPIIFPLDSWNFLFVYKFLTQIWDFFFHFLKIFLFFPFLCSRNFLSKMVCDDCQKKLGRVVTPDTWKAGSRNTIGKEFSWQFSFDCFLMFWSLFLHFFRKRRQKNWRKQGSVKGKSILTNDDT